MSTASVIQNTRSWKANIDLVFKNTGCKTVLASKRHCGPLLVQKPFYPEKQNCCHIYLIHPPAGIVGGDSLTVNANLLDDAHALITTPAATKFYRSNGHLAEQTQTINLASKSILEWLPQETVYFNGADAFSKTRINLSHQSKFIAWEIQCLGMPANNEDFSHGLCRQKLEIWQDNMPLLLECNRLHGGDKLLHSSWGMHNNKSIGTLVAGKADECLLKIVKDQSKEYNAILCGCTFLNGLLIIRAMAKYAEQVKEFFISLWQLLRPQILDLCACPPRIWQT